MADADQARRRLADAMAWREPHVVFGSNGQPWEVGEPMNLNPLDDLAWLPAARAVTLGRAAWNAGSAMLRREWARPTPQFPPRTPGDMEELWRFAARAAPASGLGAGAGGVLGRTLAGHPDPLGSFFEVPEWVRGPWPSLQPAGARVMARLCGAVDMLTRRCTLPPSMRAARTSWPPWRRGWYEAVW